MGGKLKPSQCCDANEEDEEEEEEVLFIHVRNC